MSLYAPRGWLVVALLAPAVARAATVDRLSKTVRLAPGTPVRVEATIADLTISGSDRPDLAIEIVRRAPSAADLARYPATVDEESDAVHITAVQANEGRDPNMKTEITINAPASVVFQSIRVFEGRVRLTNLKGGCDVDLRRGPIEAVSIAGRVRLEVGIGSLILQKAELTPDGMMRLRVFNGPLRVSLARPPSSARILAVVFNGTITSDIPLTMTGQFGPRFGETTIGAGDPVMSMDVVKGDIAIKINPR